MGNKLTDINLSGDTNLKYINLNSNQLTELKGLEYVDGLHTLDVSFNNFTRFELRNSSLQVLYMSHNLLESIQLEAMPELKNLMLTSNSISSINLNTLLLSDNKIAALDLSLNTSLIDLRVDRNPDLKCIKIGNQQEIPTVKISDYQSLNTACEN